MIQQDSDRTDDIQTPDPAAGAPAGDAPAGEPGSREVELEAEAARLKNEVLYARAETENVRRRLEQQAEDRGKYAIANFAKEILQVADNLRRALEAMPAEARAADPAADTLAQGVELTERSLISVLDRFGIQRIEAMGQKFDPNLHQAMMEIESADQPPGTVVLEMQAGYTINGRLLRASMVGVAKGGAQAHPGDGGVDTLA